MKNGKGQPLISQDKIDEVWEFLHAMVRICIRHIHISRKPQVCQVVSKSDDGEAVTKEIIQYTEEYCPTLSVRKLVEEWKVKM